MRKRFIKFNQLKLCAAFAFTFSLLSLTNAQENNSLRLKLVDQNSGLVEKATAVLKNDKGFERRENVGSEIGFIAFTSLEKGNYTLEITSPGFKPLIKIVNIESGKNFLEQVLEIQPISENVTVKLSKREKRFQDAVNKTFTQEEIKQLPDNPQEIENEFKRRYGEDIVIRVDGFTGGQFPDKSQIASITVILSPVDAEFHFVGKTLIDVKTKVAVKKNWSGFFSGTFADARLNARNAFAAERLPMQDKGFYFSLNPPSAGKRISFSFSVSGSDGTNEQNFLRQTPVFFEAAARSARNIFFAPSFRFNYNLSKNHTLFVNYRFQRSTGERLGLGFFDSSERSYSTSNRSNTVQMSENATLGRYSNQFRIEYADGNSRTTPDNYEPTIIILNEINKGGSGIDTREKYRRINFTDIINFDRSGHLTKIGGELEYRKNTYFDASNANGRFTFATAEDFRLNAPLLFEQRQGTSLLNLSQISAALFFQDYVSFGENFQIGVGGRWEAQSRIGDFNNFSPRLSFVWSPEKTGKLILRGGFGTLFTYLDSSFLSPILSSDGEQSSKLIIENPEFPNPFFTSSTILRSEKPSVVRLDKARNPEMYLSFLGAIYTPVDRVKLTLAYFSNKGAYQPRIRDINAPGDGFRPDPNFGRIELYEFAGNIITNALIFKSEIKYRGFLINSDYTLSKSTADFNDGGLPSDSNNVSLDRGPIIDDQRHDFTIDSRFSLYKLIKYKPLNNVDASLIFSAKSGLPYTITTGRDDNGDSVINDRPAGVGRNSERGDWFSQFDARLSWKPLTRIKNQMTITVTAQNLFNQVNRQNFIGIKTSPFFRQAISAAPARSVQIGLSYLF